MRESCDAPQVRAMSRAGWRGIAGLLVLLLGAMSGTTHAKGRARSFQLEGTIQRATANAPPEQFALTGDLIVLDCRQECATATWQQAGRMEVRIRFRKGQFFRVWTPDRHGAAVREPETMFAVIQDAADHGHRVRLDLVEPSLHFGALGDVKQIEAELEGITDFHLR
jgi:hypothetical protein